MPAYKDEKTGKWYAKFYYKDFTGKNVPKMKRGFELKRDAVAFEEDFKYRKQGTIEMTFNSLWEEYKEDLKNRIKESTWETKIAIVDKKILPYFDNVKVIDIDERMIIKWQNEILDMKKPNGEPYAETYLRTINNQLSAIINHAVTYYKLPSNPIHNTGAIGVKQADINNFWTFKEFKQFIKYYENDTLFNVIFHILYFTGIRSGELLALTLDSFNFEDNILTINSNWGRRKRRNALTSTKTRSSNRIVTFPDIITPLMEAYVDSLYDYQPNQRLFIYTNKSDLNRKLKAAAKATGVKEIRIQDLRHSNASLLIELGENIKVVQERLGHKNADTTMNTYSHMYPTKQAEVKDKLNQLLTDN